MNDKFSYFDVGTADPIGKYAQPKSYSASGNATVEVTSSKAKADGGPSNSDRKKYGRNMSRVMNQRGK